MKYCSYILMLSLILFSCTSNEADDIEEVWEEPSKEFSDAVSGEDLLRYFSKNLNSSHNNTVLIILKDSVRILGKEMDSMLALNDSTIIDLYWKTNDWLRSQKVKHDGEDKYYVKMTDLLPDNKEVKETFPNDYHLLQELKPSDGLKLARDKVGYNFFYQMKDSVFLQTNKSVEKFSKEQFSIYFDSIVLRVSESLE